MDTLRQGQLFVLEVGPKPIRAVPFSNGGQSFLQWIQHQEHMMTWDIIFRILSDIILVLISSAQHGVDELVEVDLTVVVLVAHVHDIVHFLPVDGRVVVAYVKTLIRCRRSVSSFLSTMPSPSLSMILNTARKLSTVKVLASSIELAIN